MRLKSMRESVNEYYTRGEELAHGATHGLGAFLALAGWVVLMVLALLEGNGWHILGFAVYGASVVLLFSASTLYHSVQTPRLRPLLRRLDHSAIFLLIAGTYTPFALIALRSPRGYLLLAAIWTVAVLGILYKIFFINRFEVLSTLAYVVMGWMCMLVYRQMLATIPPAGMTWLIAGGVVYTLGVIFYGLNWLPYNHAVWHLFVLAGSACHFVAVGTLLNAG